MTKTQKIEAINKKFSDILAHINDRREYRMKNYYDCVDDYSWGGLCDKADNEAEDRARRVRDIMIEEVNNDGYHLEYSSYWRLVDVNTGKMANGVRYYQYGKCFVINGKYVGIPKKLATLTKKGYRLEHVDRTYKCVFDTVTSAGNFANKSIEILHEDVLVYSNPIIDEETISTMGETKYVDYQYDLNNA